MQMYRSQVIGVQKIADVLKEGGRARLGQQAPWRLFNAATSALTGRVSENSRATADLHKIIDGTCELVP